MALQTFSAQASFGDETARRVRLGLGAEYRGPAWQVETEVTHDTQALDAVGMRLQSTWSPDDHWQLGAEFDSQSNDIPLRASAVDIDARTLHMHVLYTHNESRSWRADLGQVWFSDGNRRTQLSTR